MSRWQKVREHIWPDENGEPVLRHTKYLTPRGVAFPWQHRETWVETGLSRWFDGEGKDQGIVHPLLYRRDVFAQADRSQHCWVAEGEKDVTALTRAGELTVTAGGVFAFKAEHALLFRGWRGPITIVRDNDLPGALGAARTYAALRDVGIAAARLRVARGRCRAEGSDAYDHLRAGYTVRQFVAEPIAQVRRLAARATAETFASAGYGDWTVVGAGELKQLRDWKPAKA